MSTPVETAEEDNMNHRRWEESGGRPGDSDNWKWTLNWNDITNNMVVGSCPRTPSDMDRLVDEAGVDAVLCLQSDGCFDALGIDWKSIRERGLQRDVLMTRVSTWDFSHGDQSLMLPEAVRMLAVLVAMGRRVYVHCTAGINRATLAIVGYLTFVQAWDLNDAVALVKQKRPQAHPYLDCWHTAHARLTEGRTEEIMRMAASLHQDRLKAQQQGWQQDAVHDEFADWLAAEKLIIKEVFERQIGASLSLASSLSELSCRRVDSLTRDSTKLKAELGQLRDALYVERLQHQQALGGVHDYSEDQVRLMRSAGEDSDSHDEEGPARAAKMQAAQDEIAVLKTAIREVAMATYVALKSTAPAPQQVSEV